MPNTKLSKIATNFLKAIKPKKKKKKSEDGGITASESCSDCEHQVATVTMRRKNKESSGTSKTKKANRLSLDILKSTPKCGDPGGASDAASIKRSSTWTTGGIMEDADCNQNNNQNNQRKYSSTYTLRKQGGSPCTLRKSTGSSTSSSNLNKVSFSASTMTVSRPQSTPDTALMNQPLTNTLNTCTCDHRRLRLASAPNLSTLVERNEVGSNPHIGSNGTGQAVTTHKGTNTHSTPFSSEKITLFTNQIYYLRTDMYILI